MHCPLSADLTSLGGGCCPLSADSTSGRGGEGAVHFWLIQPVGGRGGGGCPLSANSASGGGGGVHMYVNFYHRERTPFGPKGGGGGGAMVPPAPPPLVTPMIFIK